MTAWRKCNECGGSCRWDGKAWVCVSCKQRWTANLPRTRYAPPGETRRLDDGNVVHAFAKDAELSLCGYVDRDDARVVSAGVSCVHCRVAGA